MKISRSSPFFAALLVTSALGNSPLQAAEAKLVSSIKLEFLGIGIGKMNSSISVTKGKYSISGVVKTSGLAVIVSRTRASFASAGRIRGARIEPGGHELKYTSNRKKGSLMLAFSKGNISRTTVVPKVKYKKGTIPVKPKHLNRVLDPVSALLFPVKAGDVGDGNRVCNRTLPVFDGKARMNLVFSYKSEAIREAEGFKGMTFTCSIRYQPVSGFRPSKKNVKFMKANRDMAVTMARVGDSNVYALFGFRVRTDKGMASGYASKFVVQ